MCGSVTYHEGRVVSVVTLTFGGSPFVYAVRDQRYRSLVQVQCHSFKVEDVFEVDFVCEISCRLTFAHFSKFS